MVLLVENKKVIFLTLLLTVALALYFIMWHYTSLTISGSHSVVDVPEQFMNIASSYLILSVIITCIIFFVMLFATGRRFRNILIGFILFIFSISAIIRMLDWGALYFGGNHVDSNFWAHAFYTDGLSFLVTKEAAALYAVTAIFFTALYFILKRISLLLGTNE